MSALPSEGHNIASGVGSVDGGKIFRDGFCGTLEASKEGRGGHGTEKAKRRIAKVEQAVAILEQDRLIGSQLGGNRTDGHTHSTDFSIRQLVSGTSEPTLINALTDVSSCRSSKTVSVRRDPINEAFAAKWDALLTNLLTPRIDPRRGQRRLCRLPLCGEPPRSGILA